MTTPVSQPAVTAETLPSDAARALLVGRAWLPGVGPSPVLVREGRLLDIGALAATMASLLEREDLARALRSASGPDLGALEEWLAAAVTASPSPRG